MVDSRVAAKEDNDSVTSCTQYPMSPSNPAAPRILVIIEIGVVHSTAVVIVLNGITMRISRRNWSNSRNNPRALSSQI